MNLIDEIEMNWASDIPGFAHFISTYKDTPYPSWTVKLSGEYGVAIPYDGPAINESFSNVHIYSTTDIITNESGPLNILLLTTDSDKIGHQFASLCADLIDPGLNGETRSEIVTNPVSWWKKWKELLGNKNIDARVYDVLGELCVLYTLAVKGEEVFWNGPDCASYDIETGAGFVEVKSTTSRDKKEITISNKFQLDPPEKFLKLVLCVFEPTVQTGISINSIVHLMTKIGFNSALINQRLSSLGFEEGMSARNKTFILHEMLGYTVDQNFPRITPEMFVGGVIPAGITRITYTVDVSGMPSEALNQGVNYDI